MTARLVLSKREAADLLGVDRGRTMGELIRSGQLRPIPWGKGQRIPLEEVQRLAREGFKTPGAKLRPSRPRRAGKADPAALRKLDLDTLAGRSGSPGAPRVLGGEARLQASSPVRARPHKSLKMPAGAGVTP